jgi:hypothetical protein
MSRDPKYSAGSGEMSEKGLLQFWVLVREGHLLIDIPPLAGPVQDPFVRPIVTISVVPGTD